MYQRTVFLNIVSCTATADYTYKKAVEEKRSRWCIVLNDRHNDKMETMLLTYQ
jgi:hypothetical protein